MWYTYVLKCNDGCIYIGLSGDLRKRLSEHKHRSVNWTSKRLPVKLVYYEACLDKKLAQARERYFKTGFGRQFLNKRINP